MTYLIKDKDGKKCLAKTAFMLAFVTCLFKILLSGMIIGDIEFAAADYQGMAIFLCPLGAVYWGRSYTKGCNVSL